MIWSSSSRNIRSTFSTFNISLHVSFPYENAVNYFSYTCIDELNQRSCLLSIHLSGFTAIQWWSSVGIVASYWSSGDDTKAENYYSTIEALPGDGSAVISTLHLAFKANQTFKKRGETPLEVILQLCNMTGNSLITSVTDQLQDHFSSTENELHRVSVRITTVGPVHVFNPVCVCVWGGGGINTVVVWAL